MGFGFMVVAAGVAAGCYYGYRKLQQVETDIRAELQAKGLDAAQETPQRDVGQKPAAPPLKPVASAAPGDGNLEARVTELLKASPGMLQTELYTHFPDGERKALQAALLKMDKAGTLRRSKEKSTYRLELP